MMPSNNWGGDTKEEKGNCYAQIDLMIKGDLRHDVSHETHDQFYNIFFVLPAFSELFQCLFWDISRQIF